VRLSFIEGVCLVAIGMAMVELHDGQRFSRPGMNSGTTLATGAKPAAGGLVRLHDVVNLAPNEGYR
jgi:hypothetical protein